MPSCSRTFHLSSPADTSRYARILGKALTPGDVILMQGQVGAGKTHFARQLIQSQLDPIEHVPSPTFTLVQTYQTQRGPLWHCDLYRIGSPFEIEELGLFEALDEAICLIEWPDRLGDLQPDTALTLTFLMTDEAEGRDLRADWTDKRWQEKLAGWGHG